MSNIQIFQPQLNLLIAKNKYSRDKINTELHQLGDTNIEQSRNKQKHTDHLKNEIDRRFRLSKANGIYQFPRSEQDCESNDDSLKSLISVGVYHLNKRLILKRAQQSKSPTKQQYGNNLLSDIQVSQRIKTEGSQYEETITVQQLRQQLGIACPKPKVNSKKLGKEVFQPLLEYKGITQKYLSKPTNIASSQQAYGYPKSNSDRLKKEHSNATVHISNPKQQNKSSNNQSPIIAKQLNQSNTAMKSLNLNLIGCIVLYYIILIIVTMPNSNQLGSMTDRNLNKLMTPIKSITTLKRNSVKSNGTIFTRPLQSQRIKTQVNEAQSKSISTTLQDLLKHFEKTSGRQYSEVNKLSLSSGLCKSTNNKLINSYQVQQQQAYHFQKKVQTSSTLMQMMNNKATVSSQSPQLKPYTYTEQKHHRNQTHGNEKSYRMATEVDDPFKSQKSNMEQTSNYFKRGKSSLNK